VLFIHINIVFELNAANIAKTVEKPSGMINHSDIIQSIFEKIYYSKGVLYHLLN